MCHSACGGGKLGELQMLQDGPPILPEDTWNSGISLSQFFGPLFRAPPRGIPTPKCLLGLILSTGVSGRVLPPSGCPGTWQSSGAAWCCWTAPQLKTRTQNPPFLW